MSRSRCLICLGMIWSNSYLWCPSFRPLGIATPSFRGSSNTVPPVTGKSVSRQWEALQDLKFKGLVPPGNPLVHQLMDSVLIQYLES